MEQEKKLIFEKMTPTDNCDISVYQDAIDFVFNENDVKNVAISGAYGSGKSSVLETYKKNHPKYHFLHISLAHFQSNNSTTERKVDEGATAKKSVSIESILEGKILNQLIHQIPPEDIPQTNFRVKKTFDETDLWIHTIFFAIFFLSMLHIIYFNSWREYVLSIPSESLRYFLSISTNPYSALISGFIAFSFSCYLLFRVIQAQKNRNIFKKLSWQGNEIEIFEESDESYFDKYLNEVLYLFENLDADVIVFEDLDRHEADKIFERLREVNTLVNLKRKNKKKRVLRFFYLLRDDIFDSKDRTKFFDFIIPVVPVVDSSNSYNQFISHLNRNNLFEKFDKTFLQGVSLYVDDMRMLKNVCNEFLVYYSRLNTIELCLNKMLAMIVYKNLFPRDFSELQLGRGFVYAVFSNKENFISGRVKSIQDKLEKKKDEITALNSETLETIQELEYIKEKREAGIPPRTYNNNQQRQAALDALNEWVQHDYSRRKLAIENRLSGALSRLESEQQALEYELEEVKNLPLSKIITRENIDQVFSISTWNGVGTEEKYLEIKESDYFDLLKYLIRNGYIDETYADYMTYFYEDSLSRVDKIFLRSITDKRAKDYGYKLHAPELVLSRLRPIDFAQKETMNFTLLDYLLKTTPESECIMHMVALLRKTKNFEFISQLLGSTTQKTNLIVRLNELWSEMFTEALTEGNLKAEQFKEYSVLSLYYSSPEAIVAMNINGILTKYISNLPDYLNIPDPQIEKLICGFKLLGVSFHRLNYAFSDKNLFKAVYREGFYDFTFENIQLMLECQYNFTSSEDIRNKNFSLVRSNIGSPLYVKIMENISAYIELVLENCDGKISDREHVAREILNSEKIGQGLKERYIKYMTEPVHSLRLVTDKNAWGTLIKSKILLPDEMNILDYFLSIEIMSDDLIAFINRCHTKLDFSRSNEKYSEKERDQFFDAVVECNEILDQQYCDILTSLGFSYLQFGVVGVADSKMCILIEKRILQMNENTLIFLRKHYPSKVVLNYIMEYLTEYVGIMDAELFSFSEMKAILAQDTADDVKLNLLAYTNEPISVLNNAFSIQIRVHILEHNLDTGDMDILFQEYSQQDEKIQGIILKYAIENIEHTIKMACKIDSSLLNALFESNSICLVDKVDVFVAMIPELARIEVRDYLAILGLHEYDKIFEPRLRPKFPIDEVSSKLLMAFQERGWIYTYFQDPGQNGYYRIRRTAVGVGSGKV